MTTDATGAVLRGVDKELAFPLFQATEGNDAYDISKLMKETGNVTLDSGFVNTASCRSAITYIDGDAGILRYRGYPIEEIAEKAKFLEIAYLLLEGELPTSEQLEGWEQDVRVHTYVHENVKEFLQGFRYDAHPMGMLLGAVSALSTFYPD